MSLDNLSATQTVRAPNAQTLISLPVPGTGRLPCTSPGKKSRRQEEEEEEENKEEEGRQSNCTVLVKVVWTQSGSRPLASERLTGQMDARISLLTAEIRR